MLWLVYFRNHTFDCRMGFEIFGDDEHDWLFLLVRFQLRVKLLDQF